jgi:hypothetical protein
MDSGTVGLACLIRHCKCSKTNKATEERDQSSMPSENTMRSERVFAAMTYVPNRFLLTKLAAVATRKFHRPNTRIQETMDEVFLHFSQANPRAEAEELENAGPLRRVEKVEADSRDARRRDAAA